MKVKVIATRTTYVECEIDVKDYAGNSKEEQIKWYSKSKNFSGEELFDIVVEATNIKDYDWSSDYEGHTELVKEKK